jgi:hypothetical protein
MGGNEKKRRKKDKYIKLRVFKSLKNNYKCDKNLRKLSNFLFLFF